MSQLQRKLASAVGHVFGNVTAFLKIFRQQSQETASIAPDNAKSTMWTVVGIVAPIVFTVAAAAVVLNRSIGRVEGEPSGLRDRFADFDRNVTRFEDRLKTLDDDVDELGRQVARLEPQLSSFESGIVVLSGFRTTLSELQDDHMTIRSELDRLTRNLVPERSEPVPFGFYQDVTGRLSRIEERLDALAARLPGAPRQDAR